MLEQTRRNRVFLFLANISKSYLFNGLLLFGLLPISKKDNKITVSAGVTCYSIMAGLCYTAVYIFVLYQYLTDLRVQTFYTGVSRVTLGIQCICSVVTICCFYIIAILNRFRFVAFYNKFLKSFGNYRAFYRGSFVTGKLHFRHLDSEEELCEVHLGLFMKAVAIHGLIILCILGVAERNYTLADIPLYKYIGFLLMPYLVQSFNTSFGFFSGSRTCFMYKKMDQKLHGIRRELQELTQSNKSAFEKMRRFCELSDLIEELARCYANVNGTLIELIDLHKFQILVIHLNSVCNVVHRLFVQYMIAYLSLEGRRKFDLGLVVVNVSQVVLAVLEILFLVHVFDACHKGSIRVGKTLQRLLHYEGLDIRLRESIEIFSIQILHTRVQITLCGMHPLDFTLVICVMNSICTYLVIMIQFYE